MATINIYSHDGSELLGSITQVAIMDVAVMSSSIIAWSDLVDTPMTVYSYTGDYHLWGLSVSPNMSSPTYKANSHITINNEGTYNFYLHERLSIQNNSDLLQQILTTVQNLPEPSSTNISYEDNSSGGTTLIITT